MTRIPVISSNLKSIGYDPSTETLEVEFRTGQVHQYANVPGNLHKALMAAPSQGEFFHARIRPEHKSRRV